MSGNRSIRKRKTLKKDSENGECLWRGGGWLEPGIGGGGRGEGVRGSTRCKGLQGHHRVKAQGQGSRSLSDEIAMHGSLTLITIMSPLLRKLHRERLPITLGENNDVLGRNKVHFHLPLIEIVSTSKGRLLSF